MSIEIELPETPETPESHKERTVGLIIATIAVALAFVTHAGNEIHQEELLTHIDSSDAYNDYQVKKAANLQFEMAEDNIELNYDRLSPAAQQKANAKLANYHQWTEENTGKAEKHKDEGDEQVKEAARLARKSGVLDIGEIALQISVVLCSITILTEQGLFARMGIGLALVGAAVAAWALTMTH